MRNSDPLDPEQSFDLELTEPQYELVTTDAQYPAFVGGFGSGKTDALLWRAIRLKSAYPTCNIAYYLPTYDLVAEIAFPRFEEKLELIGAKYKLVKSPRPMILVENGGRIILRTMDNPARIVGYEVADSLIDELDTLVEDKASAIWKKIIARNRQKKPDGSKNTIAVGTTPEGFRFTYKQWEQKVPSEEYYLIRASTYSNQYNLPATYIDDLKAAYPSALVTAYIDGLFTNLTSGTVYHSYDRALNRSNETVIGPRIINNVIQPGETLHIGLDFNVTRMAATIFVNRNNWPHAVAELVDMFDTPAAIATILSKYPNHPVFIYPDASGTARNSNNASVSDIRLLQAVKGWTVCANTANPEVKDRVLSMNILLEAGGVRRLMVNDTTCPKFAEALEKQPYDKNGEPDKQGGLDHSVDSAGYFVYYRWPVEGRGISKKLLAGV
jgi:hypothetical protein